MFTACLHVEWIQTKATSTMKIRKVCFPVVFAESFQCVYIMFILCTIDEERENETSSTSKQKQKNLRKKKKSRIAGTFVQ